MVIGPARSLAHRVVLAMDRKRAVKGGRSNGESSGVKRFRFRRRGEKRILAIEPLGQQTRTESADTKREVLLNDIAAAAKGPARLWSESERLGGVITD